MYQKMAQMFYFFNLIFRRFGEGLFVVPNSQNIYYRSREPIKYRKYYDKQATKTNAPTANLIPSVRFFVTVELIR